MVRTETLLRALAYAAVAVLAYFVLQAALPGSVVTLEALTILVLIVLFLRSVRRRRARTRSD